jgi:hypothetical protein
VIDPDAPNRKVEVQLWIQKDPFQITAVRVLESLPPAEQVPQIQTLDAATLDKLTFTNVKGAKSAVIWKTKPRGLRYTNRATILEIEKSVTADFMGFGEQGGKNLFKKETYMNYFSKNCWAKYSHLANPARFRQYEIPECVR